MPTKQPCSYAHLGCTAKIPRNARDERQHQYNFHGLKQEFYHPETGQLLAIAKRFGGPCSLMNCFVEGCTIQQASMKSMTDHIGRHFGLRVSVDKKKATQLSTRPPPSQPDLQPEDESMPLVVSSNVVENPLPDHMPRSISPITQIPPESQNVGAGIGVGRGMTKMHPFSASPTTTLSTTQPLKPGDTSLDDGEVSEMHSLFSASSTPPGTPPPSETQALEPGDVSDDAERAEMNTEISAQQDEPPLMPYRANSNRPASHSPVSNIKSACSAFAAKAKTSYSLTINKPAKQPKGKNQASVPVQYGRPVLGITCQRCSESFKADEEFKLQRHQLTHHCLSAEFKDQKTEERIGICFRVNGKLACSYNRCGFKDTSASKLGDHMHHEHNRRRNVITEFTVSASAGAHHDRTSEVAISTPPSRCAIPSLENVSRAPPPSPLPTEAPPSPPTTTSHGHRSTHSSPSPKLHKALPQRRTNAYVLIPPPPRHVQRQRELSKVAEKIGAILSPARLQTVPIGIKNLKAVVCITCQKAVSADIVVRQNHVLREHSVKLTRQQKKDLINWFESNPRGFVISAKNLPHNPPSGEAPIPGVKVQKGLKCEAFGCNYCCRTLNTMQTHWSDSHKGQYRREFEEESDIESDFWTQASVQRLLSSSYFIVNPSLANVSSGNPYRVYLRQYGPQLQQCKLRFLEATDVNEIPLLLRITGWHEHLKGHLKDARSIARVRSLMLPPRGKESQSWRGQVLRRTIQMYMEVIRQTTKKNRCGLRIRKLLVEQLQTPPQSNKNPTFWTFVTKKSEMIYGLLLYKFSRAILLAKPNHVSKYQFPLTNGDKQRAKKLEEALKALGEEKEGPRRRKTDSPFEGSDYDDAEIADEDESEDDRHEDHDEDEDDEEPEPELDEDESDEAYELDSDTDDEEEEEPNDSDVVEGVGGLSESEEAAILAFHDFFKPFLLATTEISDEDSKWNNVLECLMAVYALRKDSTFRPPSLVSQTFAALHYHIRGAIVYEAVLMRESDLTKYPRLYIAVEELCRTNLHPSTHSPFNIVDDYQSVASGLVRSGSGSPPTTIVSDDKKSIDYKGHVMSIPVWQTALQELGHTLQETLDSFCYNTDFGLRIPDVVPDNWTETARGYGWVHNADFLEDPDALLKTLMVDPKLQLASLRTTEDGDVLEFNQGALWQIMDKCAKINCLLALLAFFTPGQTPRITEFGAHKHTNSTRPRTVFRSQKDVWLVTRRKKSETLTQKETFLPTKCHPLLSECLEKYLLLIRPVEMQLALQLRGEEAYLLYSEYLWMTNCRRTTPKEMYKFIRKFLKDRCNFSGGVQEYRQVAVEIARVYLGPRAGVNPNELDPVANEKGHSADVARRYFAVEANHLPGMSSDLLKEYGSSAEAWWGVAGFNHGSPPSLPLQQAGADENDGRPKLKLNESQLRALMACPQLLILLVSLVYRLLLVTRS